MEIGSPAGVSHAVLAHHAGQPADATGHGCGHKVERVFVPRGVEVLPLAIEATVSRCRGVIRKARRIGVIDARSVRVGEPRNVRNVWNVWGSSGNLDAWARSQYTSRAQGIIQPPAAARRDQASRTHFNLSGKN
jgi:hypothetical protein